MELFPPVNIEKDSIFISVPMSFEPGYINEAIWILEHEKAIVIKFLKQFRAKNMSEKDEFVIHKKRKGTTP